MVHSSNFSVLKYTKFKLYFLCGSEKLILRGYLTDFKDMTETDFFFFFLRLKNVSLYKTVGNINRVDTDSHLEGAFHRSCFNKGNFLIRRKRHTVTEVMLFRKKD